MRRDLANLFLLVFTTVFLNVVVPGHVRGAITVDGPAKTAALGCDTKHEQPTEAEKQKCAVCAVAARYMTPTVAIVAASTLGLVGLLPLPPPAAAPVAAPRLTYDACGPPVA